MIDGSDAEHLSYPSGEVSIPGMGREGNVCVRKYMMLSIIDLRSFIPFPSGKLVPNPQVENYFITRSMILM